MIRPSSSEGTAIADAPEMLPRQGDASMRQAGQAVSDQENRGEERSSAINVGGVERIISVAAGSILAAAGLNRRSVPGLLIAAVGGAMIYRGATGHCHAYSALDINTAREEAGTAQETFERGIAIETAILIQRPAEQIYAFWRDFTNLPKIMSHLESVTVEEGGRRSRWVAKAPVVAGGRVEWDAEVTADEPNRRIAWQSVGGNRVDTAGEVRFEQAPGDRGTEVHVRMAYAPPGGKLGHVVTSLLGKNPRRLVREDLRNLQRIMEVGEILTTEGQPRGTCTGQGERQSESSWRPLFS
jgi:uncharacterized membrane protein